MRKVQYTVEELTCPECGFVAINANGLRGHRQFKHGVRPSGAQLPLQKQDLLVSESKLAQLLDERFGVISDQVNELSGEQGQLANALEQLAKSEDAAITELQERVAAAERKSMDDFSPREKAEFVIPWLEGLNEKDFFTLARDTGHDVVPDPAVVTILAETFKEPAPESVIQGKTELPGYRYLEMLELSVYVGEEELDKERQELIEAIGKGIEQFGDQLVDRMKIATELVGNLAEIQRRREQAKRKK